MYACFKSSLAMFEIESNFQSKFVRVLITESNILDFSRIKTLMTMKPCSCIVYIYICIMKVFKQNKSKMKKNVFLYSIYLFTSNLKETNFFTISQTLSIVDIFDDVMKAAIMF